MGEAVLAGNDTLEERSYFVLRGRFGGGVSSCSDICIQGVDEGSSLQQEVVMYPSDLPVEDLIREARESFNAAIANRDIDAIRSLLAPDYHIVTGRSEQSNGADEEARRWTERFRSDPTVIYRRTPREITVNEDWGLAEELGNWKGNYTIQEVLVHTSGRYAAKWHRAEDGAWVLQAELFTTITCTGPEGGCLPPSPIYR
jgi:ketosteroid isomerase-like protein